MRAPETAQPRSPVAGAPAPRSPSVANTVSSGLPFATGQAQQAPGSARPANDVTSGAVRPQPGAPHRDPRHETPPPAPPASPPATRRRWRLRSFTGLFSEISGGPAGAPLTLACRLVHEAQQRGEPVAWIGRDDSSFFPPDAAAAGIDLDALAVIRVPEALPAARAADHLLRSGGFGVVVLDVGTDSRLPVALQSRLAGLARKHDAALLCLTEKERQRASIGPLVSLRLEAVRGKRAGDRFRCEWRVLKDKRRGPGPGAEEVCRGPDGVC